MTVIIRTEIIITDGKVTHIRGEAVCSEQCDNMPENESGKLALLIKDRIKAAVYGEFDDAGCTEREVIFDKPKLM